jgi:hypothetical protein
MARIEVTCLFLCDEIWLVISSAQTTFVFMSFRSLDCGRIMSILPA